MADRSESTGLLWGLNIMTMHYSASTGGFYITEVHGDQMPLDAVVITESAHAALLVGQSQGKRIVPDADGRPILVDPPPAPPPVPAAISDRQFFQQLAVAGIISHAEALAAVKTGEIPAALASIVDALPDADRFAAEMLLSGAVTFERHHPLTEAVGEARGLTADEIDAFFQAAAVL